MLRPAVAAAKRALQSRASHLAFHDGRMQNLGLKVSNQALAEGAKTYVFKQETCTVSCRAPLLPFRGARQACRLCSRAVSSLLGILVQSSATSFIV